MKHEVVNAEKSQKWKINSTKVANYAKLLLAARLMSELEIIKIEDNSNTVIINEGILRISFIDNNEALYSCQLPSALFKDAIKSYFEKMLKNNCVTSSLI